MLFQPCSQPGRFEYRYPLHWFQLHANRRASECGSCYAFGSSATYEARLRILSNLTRQDIVSPQDIVSCSNYSQGCAGGFPYLVGKYAEDFGLVQEQCYPYSALSSKCALLSFD